MYFCGEVLDKSLVKSLGNSLFAFLEDWIEAGYEISIPFSQNLNSINLEEFALILPVVWLINISLTIFLVISSNFIKSYLISKSYI